MRDVALELFLRSGLAAVARRLLARRGRFVLELHGVARKRLDKMPAHLQPSYCLDELETLLRWLKGRFRFLSPEQFLSAQADGVLLTFDDGYANQASNAMPLLEEHGVPAVFFVTTQHVADPGNWLPSIRRAVEQSPDNLSADEHHDLFDGMSVDELRRVAASSCVTVGSHTVSHPLLSRCGDEELEAELVESKRFLEEAIDHPVELFAYPTGNYDRRVADAVHAVGYRAAFVEESRGLGLGRWEIPRIGLYSARPAYLAAKLSGLYRRPLHRAYDDDA